MKMEYKFDFVKQILIAAVVFAVVIITSFLLGSGINWPLAVAEAIIFFFTAGFFTKACNFSRK